LPTSEELVVAHEVEKKKKIASQQYRFIPVVLKGDNRIEERGSAFP
jgi:hypothetical protein